MGDETEMAVQLEKARPTGPAAPEKEPRSQRLSSVTTAVRLLKMFTEDEAEIGVTSLAKRLGVAKSTVYRLASTLVAEGMLEQNPETERYRLGIALFGLGALVRQRMNLSNEARPYIFDLRDATNETVHLAVLDRAEILYVYDLESTQAIRMSANLGARKPALCTAEGLAILAFQPDPLVDKLLSEGFRKRTPKTDTDAATLRARLADVRKHGFAREDEQSELGMRSIAAPVRDSTGQVIGAVGMAGPLQRLSDETLTKLAPLVVNTANAISLRLGYKAAAHY
jgi:DNA-binding IclR family transcriptional regulator